MPAFFDLEFFSLSNPELWVGVGLLLFIAVVILAGGHKLAAGHLDSHGAKIKANLDEAARIRAEAEALLAGIHAQKLQIEEQAKAMLAEAREEAARLEIEAREKLEEQMARRSALADRRIATAEAQATAEVKAAAADLAAQATETVLAARLKGSKSDPLIDRAIGELATRLQ